MLTNFLALLVSSWKKGPTLFHSGSSSGSFQVGDFFYDSNSGDIQISCILRCIREEMEYKDLLDHQVKVEAQDNRVTLNILLLFHDQYSHLSYFLTSWKSALKQQQPHFHMHTCQFEPLAQDIFHASLAHLLLLLLCWQLQ